MKHLKHFRHLALAGILIYLVSCAATSHPNEKIIIGKWRPLKVEKFIDSAAIQAMAGSAGASKSKSTANPSKPSQTEGPALAKAEAALDRLVKAESRATLEIFPNKTAVKNYPGKPLQATWKMKGNGTRLVGKNLENKMKFTIDILEISKEQIVVLEHAPVGDVKITYVRMDPNETL